MKIPEVIKMQQARQFWESLHDTTDLSLFQIDSKLNEKQIHQEEIIVRSKDKIVTRSNQTKMLLAKEEVWTFQTHLSQNLDWEQRSPLSRSLMKKNQWCQVKNILRLHLWCLTQETGWSSMEFMASMESLPQKRQRLVISKVQNHERNIPVDRSSQVHETPPKQLRMPQSLLSTTSNLKWTQMISSKQFYPKHDHLKVNTTTFLSVLTVKH